MKFKVSYTASGRLAMVVLAAAAALSSGGCTDGKPTRHPVKGCVTYRGNPVKGGWVSFTRLDEAEKGTPMRPATGELDDAGRYVMKTFGANDGVMPGRYAVAIVAIDYEKAKATRDPRQPQPFLIPAKYTRPETSGLTVTIPQEYSEPLEFNFELTD